MSHSAENAIKTTAETVKEDALVFSTKLTLDERFSNSQSNTVVLTNGFTVPYKNKELQRVVFGCIPSVRISNRVSSNSPSNVDKISRKRKKRLLTNEEQLPSVAKRRHVVLIPTEAKDGNSAGTPHIDSNKEASQYQNIKASTPKQSETDNVHRKGDSVEKHFKNLDEKKKEHCSSDEFDEVSSGMLSGTNCIVTNSDQDDSKEPIIFSPLHLEREKRQSFCSWNRKRLKKKGKHWRGQLLKTKEDLDNEIDAYMAEVKLKTSALQSGNDVVPFVQEYMMEVDKCCAN